MNQIYYTRLCFSAVYAVVLWRQGQTFLLPPLTLIIQYPLSIILGI